MNLENVKYDAFISYRHCELDSFVCNNLHKKLESFRISKSIAKKMNLKRQKLDRVFRDVAELPLTDNLSEPIENALENSDFLIVICTPRLKESVWCQKEIETFLKTHDRDHVLAVLAEGEPEDSFPEILTYEEVTELDENNNEVVVRKELEPLAAECRGENNRERLKAMDEQAVIKIIAAIFDLNFDDLKQRQHEERQRKRRLRFTLGFSAVSLFALTCLFFMLRINKQKNEINRQKIEIEDKFASDKADDSKELYYEGHRKDAIYLARAVLPDKPEGYNYDAYRALVNAVSPYSVNGTYIQTDDFTLGGPITSNHISPLGTKIVFCEDNGPSEVYDIVSKEIIMNDLMLSDYGRFISFDGENALVYSNEEGVFEVNLETKETVPLSSENLEVVNSPSGDLFLINTDGVTLVKEGEQIYNKSFSSMGISFSEMASIEDISFSSDSLEMVLAIYDYDGVQIILMDTRTGRIIYCAPYEGDTESVFVGTDDGYIYFITCEDDYYSSRQIYYLNRLDGYLEDLSLYQTEIRQDYVVGLKVNENGILVWGEKIAEFYDWNLKLTSRLQRSDAIQCVFDYEDGFGIIDENLSVYLMNFLYPEGADLSYYFFGDNNEFTMNNAFYKNGVIYAYKSYDNSVSVFGKKNDDRLVSFNDDSITIRLFSDDVRDEVSGYIDNVEYQRIQNAIYSDDQKYLLISLNDGTVNIYSVNDSYKPVKTFYFSTDRNWCDGFLYDKQNDVYVLCGGMNVRLLDSELNLFTEIRGQDFFGIEEETGNLIFSKHNKDLYSIPIYSYEEIIAMADKELQGYVPSDKLADRYNISVSE